MSEKSLSSRYKYQETYCIIHWIEICPVDGIKNLLNNCDLQELWKGSERGQMKEREA